MVSSSLDERAGVVLAGGYSRRFGDGDKALAEFEGTPLLSHVVDRVTERVGHLLVSCREEQIENFTDILGPRTVEFVPDPIPDRGPLAGIHASLETVDARYVTVVACDMPLVEGRFLDFMFDRLIDSDVDAVVPQLRDGTHQPTQAVYDTAAMLSASNKALDEDNRSLQRVLDSLDVEFLPPETVASATDWQTLRNVNTPEELATLEADFED